jgi:hypothetical protein
LTFLNESSSLETDNALKNFETQSVFFKTKIFRATLKANFQGKH